MQHTQFPWRMVIYHESIIWWKAAKISFEVFG